MTVLPILIIPDKTLKMISKPVERVDDELRKFLDDMCSTMYAAPGIGLAAVQVGILKRAVVIDVSRDEDARAPMHFINPEITWVSDELSTYDEGCLSIPEIYEEVERPSRCRVNFLDYEGAEQEIECEGLLATCIQHEVDHLNGILFLDHISRLKRDRITKKFIKARRLESTG
jgi:peptide deformylase